MSGFSDLVLAAQPAIVKDGCTAPATEGMTWKWIITGFTDAAGTAVDLSAVTGTCTLYTAVGGSVVTTLTVTGASDGSITLYKDEAATVGLAAGADSRGIRTLRWSLTLNNGTDTVCVWNTTDSKFIIEKAA